MRSSVRSSRGARRRRGGVGYCCEGERGCVGSGWRGYGLEWVGLCKKGDIMQERVLK